MEGVINLNQNQTAVYELPAVQLGVSWALIVPLVYYANHGTFWFQGAGSNSATDSLGASYGQIIGGARSSLDLAVQIAIFAIVSVLLLTRLKAILRLCWKHKVFVLIPFVAAASVLWSQDPSVTLNNSVYLGINVLFAFYLSRRFSPRRLLQVLLMVGTACLILSVAFSVFVPKYGLDMKLGDHAWKGVYGSKNICGAMTTFFLAGAFYAPTPTSLARLWRAAYICLSLILVVMSKSATSVIIASLLLIYVVAVKLAQRLKASDRVTATFFAILLMGSTFGAAISSLDQVLHAFGKNSTLTGRTAVWQSVLEAAWKRPLLGYGYSAFWQSSGRVSSTLLENRWSVTSAHNGYLEVWLSLGAIGLALVLVTFAKAVLDAARCVLRGGSPYLNWFASLIFLALLLNLDESHLMVPNDLLSVLYVLACVGLADGAARIGNRPQVV